MCVWGGGGGGLSNDSILGGLKTVFFLLTLYDFIRIRVMSTNFPSNAQMLTY